MKFLDFSLKTLACFSDRVKSNKRRWKGFIANINQGSSYSQKTGFKMFYFKTDILLFLLLLLLGQSKNHTF